MATSCVNTLEDLVIFSHTNIMRKLENQHFYSVVTPYVLSVYRYENVTFIRHLYFYPFWPFIKDRLYVKGTLSHTFSVANALLKIIVMEQSGFCQPINMS
jgi:hypothetical protein